MTRTQLKIIHRPEDIPQGMTQEQEAAFWDEHTLAPELWEQTPVGAPDLDVMLAGVTEVVAEYPNGERATFDVKRPAQDGKAKLEPRSPFQVAKATSKPLHLEKKVHKVRKVLNRQAEKQGKTPDEPINEKLKKKFRVF